MVLGIAVAEVPVLRSGARMPALLKVLMPFSNETFSTLAPPSSAVLLVKLLMMVLLQ